MVSLYKGMKGKGMTRRIDEGVPDDMERMPTFRDAPQGREGSRQRRIGGGQGRKMRNRSGVGTKPKHGKMKDGKKKGLTFDDLSKGYGGYSRRKAK